jgi:hypothetical protein
MSSPVNTVTESGICCNVSVRPLDVTTIFSILSTLLLPSVSNSFAYNGVLPEVAIITASATFLGQKRLLIVISLPFRPFGLQSYYVFYKCLIFLTLLIVRIGRKIFDSKNAIKRNLFCIHNLKQNF